MLRLAPWIIVFILVVPVAGGTLLTVPPAFGYLPVLGGDEWSFRPRLALAQTPGIQRSVAVSFGSGLLATGLALIIVFLFLSTIANTRFDRWIQRLVSPLLVGSPCRCGVRVCFSGRAVRLATAVDFAIVDRV